MNRQQAASSVVARLAGELAVPETQVEAAIGLFDGGATVPFVARYRKEATGGLDDAQLRLLQERLVYLRELDDRREAVLKSIRQQGKLDADLEKAIFAADSKSRLEDIYLPFKPKRRNKADAAREAGLEPLADLILARRDVSPQAHAGAFADVDKGVADAAAALEGARAILVERFAQDADLLGNLREMMWSKGQLVSKLRDGRRETGAKFSDYFDFAEPFRKLPSHRILALFRGEKEEILDLAFEAEPAKTAGETSCEQRIKHRVGVVDLQRPGDVWLADVVRWAWRTKISVAMTIDLRVRLWSAAEEEGVRVFAGNLRDLLLAAPAGPRPTMGLDPGFRNGTKVAVVDATGKVVATQVVFPHEPQRRWDEALSVLGGLIDKHQVELIAIGNGTASRETDRLAADLVAKASRRVVKTVVSEAGASVYSASAFASEELPDLDVTLRGAVSIARRLQDPLAELVKIDPRSIGVGQYQHDLSEHKLSSSLDAVVEDCVNAVGVDVNTASVPLLARVSGVGPLLAQNIVLHRDTHGGFRSRRSLQDVPRLGPKAFEQCAGFLRIMDGDDPLDRSGVHPESYPTVRRILAATTGDIRALIGNADALRRLQPRDFVDGAFGLPTVSDIFVELEKPGRDPRPTFKVAVFKEGVETLADLQPGLVLEGTVTNVAAFGAFVDIGVHQDGLVHISAMARTFVKDPRTIVKPGDIVRVKVLEVDKQRKRIALTLRLDDDVNAAAARPARSDGARPKLPATSESKTNVFADALQKAGAKPGRRSP